MSSCEQKQQLHHVTLNTLKSLRLFHMDRERKNSHTLPSVTPELNVKQQLSRQPEILHDWFDREDRPGAGFNTRPQELEKQHLSLHPEVSWTLLKRSHGPGQRKLKSWAVYPGPVASWNQKLHSSIWCCALNSSLLLLCFKFIDRTLCSTIKKKQRRFSVSSSSSSSSHGRQKFKLSIYCYPLLPNLRYSTCKKLP